MNFDYRIYVLHGEIGITVDDTVKLRLVGNPKS